MAVEFAVLGPLEVRSVGEPVRVGGPRQQKLLALLLINANQSVPVERMVDELWGEAPPPSVRQQVHNAVASLRRVFAGEQVQPIVRTTAGYRIDLTPDGLDVQRFQRAVEDAKQAEARGSAADAINALSSALSTWRGPALCGLTGQTIDVAARSLDEKRLSASEDYLRLRMQSGESGALIGELRQLVAEHPLRESLRATLVLALYRGGRSGDALSVYDEGRAVLSEDLGLDPGPALRHAHATVLSGEDEWHDQHLLLSEQDTAVRTTRSYLPHDTRDFTGRTAELEQLLAETRNAGPSTVAISAIDGMGGVGKTALAVRLAHQVADEYPDGRYFVDLHGFSSTVDPVVPEKALEMLLRDSGVPPELVPSGLARRSALWRSRLAGQRALVVLDNAVDAAHIRPLLPGTPGVLVVVTSRRKLTALEGTMPLSLDVLPQEDAEALFTRIAGAHRAAAHPAATSTAVELCGHLPLAIRIAAARLRDRSSWTVPDLVKRIRDDARRVRFLHVDDLNVMSVLKLSCRYLSDQQQRLFRLLSLHPGVHFDPYSAAALAGISADEADFCLEALFDGNLLKQAAPGRFQFHDLVRDCARQLLCETEPEGDQREAVERLLDYYLFAVHSWCRQLGSDVDGFVPDVTFVPSDVRTVHTSHHAVAVVDEQRDNLLAAALASSAQGFDRHAWQFARVLRPLMRPHDLEQCSLDLFGDDDFALTPELTELVGTLSS